LRDRVLVRFLDDIRELRDRVLDLRDDDDFDDLDRVEERALFDERWWRDEWDRLSGVADRERDRDRDRDRDGDDDGDRDRDLLLRPREDDDDARAVLDRAAVSLRFKAVGSRRRPFGVRRKE